MIEIICKEDPAKENQNKKAEGICLPKNIRQVGSPRGRHKIYMEDYVYTYLRSLAKNQEECAAVFLGKSQVEKDIRYTFVSGIIECSAAVFQWESICLDESFWDFIYKEEKQYFPELEIVGWFFGKAGQAMELTPTVEAAHRKYFSGRDKILMLLDILEEDEQFFVYEQGYLQKREGYYIYYEKNLAMQEYMISKKEEEQKLQEELKQEVTAEEIPEMKTKSNQEESKEAETNHPVSLKKPEQKNDSPRTTERDARIMLEQMRRQEKKTERKMREGAIRHKAAPQDKIFSKNNLEEPKTQAEEALDAYRRMVLERQGKQRERQSRNFLYTASSFFLVVICVIGITTINNYRKMQEVEEVLRMMNPEESGKKQSDSKGTEGLVVETIESEVSPLDENPSKDMDESLDKDPSQDGSEGTQDKEEESEEDSEDQKQQEKSEKKDDKSKDKKQQEEKKEEESDGEEENQTSDNGQESSETQQGLEPRYYTVKPGDTLNTICISIYHNKDMAQTLKKINDIEDGDKIFVGQKLLLP